MFHIEEKDVEAKMPFVGLEQFFKFNKMDDVLWKLHCGLTLDFFWFQVTILFLK